MPSLYLFRRLLTPFHSRQRQGRNLAGKVGLFPQSYTQPAPPSTGPPSTGPPASVPSSSGPADNPPSSAASPPSIEQAQLQSRPEDSSHSDPTDNAAPNRTTTGTNGEVMRATLTDVQKAIEQLGHKDDFDGSQSFTFSSSHEDSTDQETDHDTDADANGQGWHKGARQKLAEKAKKAVEELAARDAAEGRMPVRSTAPPINVEMSDDSGDEADGPSGGPSNGYRQHPHIPEEEEDEIAAPRGHVDHHSTYSSSIQPSERFIVPSPVSTAPAPSSELNEDATTEGGVSTARQSTFPQSEPASSPESLLPSPVWPPGLRGIPNGISGNDSANHFSSGRLAFPSKSQTLGLQEGASVLPSPAASLNGHQHGLSISSVTSSVRVAASSPFSAARSADLSSSRKPRNPHPAEWTVEEVVDWLRSKGFDEAVCDKFAEQEITGDVLLELDLAILKSEIGIVAYGKRMRIANAIADLRRPPSILSSEQHTRPGSLSRGSPLPHQSVPLSPSGQGSVGLESLVSPESPPNSGDLPGHPPVPARRDSDPGVRSNATDSNATIGLGLGIPTALLAAGGQKAPGTPNSLLAAGGQKGPGIPNSLLAGGGENKMVVRVQLMTA
jgi:SAM domain (Sterile alpha motif)